MNNTHTTTATESPFTFLVFMPLLLTMAAVVLTCRQEKRVPGYVSWPDCQGSPLNLTHSFNLFRQLSLDAQGKVIIDDTPATIHMAHQTGALITVLFIILVSLNVLLFNRWGFDFPLPAATRHSSTPERSNEVPLPGEMPESSHHLIIPGLQYLLE